VELRTRWHTDLRNVLQNRDSATITVTSSSTEGADDGGY
jgi:hypothetical protein